jgi:hypothetical protein
VCIQPGEMEGLTRFFPARAIQQELIDDLANKPELSDWFSRVCVEFFVLECLCMGGSEN